MTEAVYNALLNVQGYTIHSDFSVLFFKISSSTNLNAQRASLIIISAIPELCTAFGVSLSFKSTDTRYSITHFDASFACGLNLPATTLAHPL
ncbi:unnamed protein product [Haemonchus placei]|uniref:Uncharacterized protein n=1 Tax=Haemonchus placei TaxID=6290 RepID=A0A0N4WUY1_HAEPC|nr:unnamed protein product [Haemonchus placei]